MESEWKDWLEKIDYFWFRVKYFFIGYYIPVKYVILEFLTRPNKANKDVWGNGMGKVAVVTGANRGIGFHVVKELMKYDFHVVIAVRDLDAGNRAVRQIRESGIENGSASVCRINLANLDSVRQCAQQILKENAQIHLLFNNAGIAFGPGGFTDDSMQYTFQVNFLGHFLLTNLLLRRLDDTGYTSGENTRIVNMASVAQYGGHLNFDDLQSKQNYLNSKAYFDSKLAVVVTTKYLARKFEKEGYKIRINCLHPGIIPTGLWDIIPIGIWARENVGAVLPLMEDVVDRVMNLVLSAELEASNGNFYINNNLEKCNKQADDIEVQNRLWRASLHLSEMEQTS